MAVVTVSRGLGAGGEAIAVQVAQQLGIPYLDREIIRAVADQAGVSEDALTDLERGPTLLERMVGAMAGGAPDALIDPWPYTSGIGPLDAVLPYRRLIEQFIQTVAERGSAVIVGHGATAILARNPRVLRCLFAAPLAVRVARVMAEEQTNRKTAERRIADTDKAWRDFLKTYYDLDWIQPRHYDLVINTERLSQETAVDLVVRAATAIDALRV